jgi:hypothetical protein
MAFGLQKCTFGDVCARTQFKRTSATPPGEHKIPHSLLGNITGHKTKRTLTQGWPTSTPWRITQFIRTHPRATLAYVCIKEGDGGTALIRMLLFTNTTFC